MAKKKDVGYLGQRAGMTTGRRAGKSKASAATRKQQNKGTASGAIRMGAKGKGYNVYDSKTGTWKKLKTAPGSGKTGTYKGSGSGKSSGKANQSDYSKVLAALTGNAAARAGMTGGGNSRIPASTLGVSKNQGLSTSMRSMTSRENWGKAYATAAIGALGVRGLAGLRRGAGAKVLNPSPTRRALPAGKPKAVTSGSKPKAVTAGKKPKAITAGTNSQRATMVSKSRQTPRQADAVNARANAAAGTRGSKPIPMRAGKASSSSPRSARGAEGSSARSAAARKGWETRRRNASKPRRKK